MEINGYFMPVFKQRYLLPGETPEQLFHRVANAVAKPEHDWPPWAESFYDMMWNGDFMPSSPILMNAGTDYPMLSACFVLDIPDDMGGIFQSIKDMAMIQQHGGGTGFNFSKIREKGAVVKTTNGVASGVLSFLEVFNAATNIVKQGGKRRGANIAILAVDHPEIEAFVDMKLDPNAMQNFNFSVILTDEFIAAAKGDERWNLVSRANGSVVKAIYARDLMQKIEENMVKCGEPGVLFADNIELGNTTPWLGPLTGVNPCGEVSLYDKEACNLGSINLEHFIQWDSDAEVYDRLKRTIDYAVRFLDDTIDINKFPVEGIKEQVEFTRKIGLGITGLHSFLMLRGFAYDSTDGVDDATAIMKYINHETNNASFELGHLKGVAPAYENPAHTFPPRRNTVTTCIAPTGTISMILDTSSSGIEPIFSFSYTRKIDGEDVAIRPPVLHDLLMMFDVDETPELLRQIDNAGGKLTAIPSLPEGLRKIAKTANEIDPQWHLNMQAELQNYVENNISKTIAIAADSQVSLHRIDQLIDFAHDSGVRGLTVYVDGSREGQVIMAEEKCPVCGAAIVKEEGCKHCTQCGWSTCSV